MNVFKKLKNYNTRMTIILSELEGLEDCDDELYSEIASSFGEIVRSLEHRREVIQRRKYGR